MRRTNPEMRPALMGVLRLAKEVLESGEVEAEGEGEDEAGVVNELCVGGGLIFCEYVDGERGVVASIEAIFIAGGLFFSRAGTEQFFS